MEHEIVYGLWDGKEVGGEPQCELSAKTSSAAAWTENDANPTTALSATRERPSAGAPRPGVRWRTSRAKGTETMADACCSSGGELPRRPSGRPRRGGAPASCRRRPRGRTPRTIPQIPSAGWTVFQIPSTPGPCCPFDQDCAAEIIRKSLSILPPFPFPRHPRDETATRRAGDGEPGAPPVRGSRWRASTERAARRSSREFSARQRLLMAASGSPCCVRGHRRRRLGSWRRELGRAQLS